MLVDSHCHLELEDYDGDRPEVIGRAAQAGVSCMITVGTEPAYFEKVVSIIEKHDSIYGAIGIHPHNAKDYSPEAEKTIKEYLKHPKIIAYGEIGLDFYRNYSPAQLQVESFRRQIELAREAGLPVVIHSRNAKRETLEVLRTALAGHTTVIHCYSYDVETAGKILDMGMYLSVPGTVTYQNAGLAKVVRYAPLDRLLSETDAPFLTPASEKGKRNEPAFVERVVREIAALKSKTLEETAAVIMETFRSVFLMNRKTAASAGAQ